MSDPSEKLSDESKKKRAEWWLTQNPEAEMQHKHTKWIVMAILATQYPWDAGRIADDFWREINGEDK